jgi:type IV secretion system protein TrbL
MKSHRKITPIIALAVTLSAYAPASAPASSLLSGYGGPGQGAQAILGSVLLNGRSGGAGGGSAGGGPTGAAPLGAVATRGGSGGGGGGPTSSGGVGSQRRAVARQRSQRTPPAAGGGAVGSYSRLGASRSSAGDAGVFGLSDSVFLFALLALTALLFTGLLTRGLTKASGTRGHAGS